MKASLYNYKQSPRKVRLVADVIRGKSVALALEKLAFLPKKSAPDLDKLLASAVANARQMGMNPDDLIVKTITVDKGPVLRRFKPMARGRAGRIHRTMSIVKIELGTVGGVAPKKHAAATEEKAADAKEAPAKKPAAKKTRAKKAAK